MKRLIVFLVLILAGLMAGPASAQSKDIAGTWALDAEKSGSKDGPPMIVLTLTATEFTARLGSATARLMTFKTDGTEGEVSQGTRGKAAWKGNRFEATLLLPGGPETVTFWRDGAWLMVEASSEKGPVKLYFKRTTSER